MACYPVSQEKFVFNNLTLYGTFMSILLTGPTTASTTPVITGGTYTFVPDLPADNRSRVAVISAVGGTQTGVSIHTAEAPKQFITKRPASIAQPSGFNTTTGRYSKVPKNVTRVIFRGSAKVSANQWEVIPITLDLPIPAGAESFDRANVDASVLAFITGLYDQRVQICQALYDGLY